MRSSWGRDVHPLHARQRRRHPAAAGGGPAARRRLRRFVLRLVVVGLRRRRAVPDPGDRPAAAVQPVRRHQAGRRAPVQAYYAHNHGLPTVCRCATSPSTARASGRTWPSPGSAARSTTASHIELYGTGEQVRDFTYVDDVVEANLRVAADAARPRRGRLQRGGRCGDHRQRGARAARGDLRQGGAGQARRRRCPGTRPAPAGSTDAIRARDRAGRPQVPLRDGLEEQYRCVAAVLA